MHMPSRRRFANADRWGPVSQLLHWTIVAMILVMAYLGLTMTDLPNGLTILALVSLRVLWRLYAGAPRPVPGTPSWQERIASATHAALYALLFAIPLSGWFLNSTAGFPLQWFGLFNLPKLTHRDVAMHEIAVAVHTTLFWVLVALVAMHAAAALYHHLVQRDATLARMLPRGWLRIPHGDA
jgi:cytochrome b561